MRAHARPRMIVGRVGEGNARDWRLFPRWGFLLPRSTTAGLSGCRNGFEGCRDWYCTNSPPHAPTPLRLAASIHRFPPSLHLHASLTPRHPLHVSSIRRSSSPTLESQRPRPSLALSRVTAGRGAHV
ncbi:hypothetical protein FA95DRAFT_155388 [Auriscalpium vulgare]|uniref:Uncharacterized protein n=1 Tax=Auriscalpium vulgare TaxID=40419 RepID=A0ACB8QZY8_9AGAM|nr:hypothetical protein FA95DRAFT_155388 [Auriscalpium vulgare]